jgi:hypothetical protein
MGPAVLAAAVVAGAGGCYAPPLVVSEHAPTAAGVLDDPALLWSGDGWTPMPRAGSRVAIVECSVEFVTLKSETPGERQAMLGPITPVAALVDLSGAFRTRVTYPRDLMVELPRHVLELVTTVLEERGLDVIDPMAVADSDAYAHFEGSVVGRSSAAYHVNLRGSDTGRTGAFHVYPAWPLRVLEEHAHRVATGERAIRAGFDAALSLRIRLRVGVYRGRVSLEQGSVISFGTDAGTHRIVAERSVVSSRVVGTRGDYTLTGGRPYTVDWPGFRAIVLDLAPRYLGPVLPAPADAAPRTVSARR